MPGTKAKQNKRVVPWSKAPEGQLQFLLLDRPGTQLRPPVTSGPNSEPWQSVYRPFFIATTLLIPDFLRSLREDVFPAYQRLHDRLLRSAGANHKRVVRTKEGELYYDVPWVAVQSKVGEEMRSALRFWAAKFHLEEQRWAQEATLPTLGHWLRHAESRSSLEPLIYCQSEPVQLTVLVPRFSPYVDKRHYIKSARQTFDMVLAYYCKRPESSLRNQKWVVHKKLSNLPARVNLVLYQMGGLTYDQILDWWDGRLSRDPTSIQRGVGQVAKEIGLRLRGAKRGRPRNPAE